MEFYSRNTELNEIRRLQWLSREQHGRTLLLSGVPGSGKTTLLHKALDNNPVLHLRCGNRTHKHLASAFTQTARLRLGAYIPTGSGTISGLLEQILASIKEPLSIVFDNFGNFAKDEPAECEKLAKVWQERREGCNVLLVFCTTDIEAASLDKLCPTLSAVIDNRLEIKNFSPQQLKEIIAARKPDYTAKDLLALYAVTGGSPKYVNLLCANCDLTVNGIYGYIFSEGSPLLQEGEIALGGMLGKNSRTYYTILERLAAGDDNIKSLQNTCGGNIGSYLAKLEAEYGIIRKLRPPFAGEGDRNILRYEFKDRFLHFWFKYIGPNKDILEAGGNETLLHWAENDAENYLANALKGYFAEKLGDGYGYASCGPWWLSAKGSDGIDIVAHRGYGSGIMAAKVCMDTKVFDSDAFARQVKLFRKKVGIATEIDARLLTLEDM